jgi:LysR family hydrogen peroxide-inducible transcriptional activator
MNSGYHGMHYLPTTKQLKYLSALYKYRHFGMAAEACHVSQPAFSIAIKELESLLDHQLVDRTNRKLTFTSIGKEVAVQARLVLQDLENLVEIAANNREPLCGQLRLGAIPTIAPFVFPRLLPRLRKQYPQLKLYLQEGQTHEIYTALMQGDLDLILIAMPYDLRNTESMELFTDKFYLAFNRHTALFNKNNHTVEQLPDGSVLLLQDGHCLRDHALSACKIRNIEKVSPVTASSLLTLVQMVDADMGVTYLPEMALKSNLLKYTRIETSPLGKNAVRKIALAWRKGTGRQDEFRMLGDFIRKES